MEEKEKNRKENVKLCFKTVSNKTQFNIVIKSYIQNSKLDNKNETFYDLKHYHKLALRKYLSSYESWMY